MYIEKDEIKKLEIYCKWQQQKFVEQENLKAN